MGEVDTLMVALAVGDPTKVEEGVGDGEGDEVGEGEGAGVSKQTLVQVGSARGGL